MEASGSRRHAGFFEHGFHGSLTLEGEGALDALQGQVTQELRGLQPGTGRYACHLDRKGGLVTDLVVLAVTDRRLDLLVPAENLQTLETKLRPVAMLADCTLSRPAVEPARFLLAGPATFQTLSQLTGERFKLDPFTHRPARIGAIATRLIGWPETGDHGALIEVEPAAVADLLEAVLTDDRTALAGDEAWEILRVESGFPVWGRDLGPGRLPPEAGLEHAISYTKGCYVGQETIARIRTYGRVNRQLVGLDFERSFPLGAELVAADRVVGTVTSALNAGSNGQPRGLGYVKRAHLEAGTRLLVRDADGRELGTATVGPRISHPRLYEALPAPPHA